MIMRNPHFERLQTGYLFPEIYRRKAAHLKRHPGGRLLALGVGDTTQPLPQPIAERMATYARALATESGYVGYGPEEGYEELRARIAQEIYGGKLKSDEITISDGVNSDIARLQTLFGSHPSISVQDPTYPVYVDGSLIQGVREIVRLVCRPDNDFFPQLREPTDLIYFCSPNNPTGAAASFEQLRELVNFARSHRSIILFDAAYSAFVQEENRPRSIFEIEGAEEVAIEIGSFSKSAGFTGVRLGWTALSKRLRYSDGRLVHPDWMRIVTTLFNGASCLSQAGALAVLDNLPLVKEQVRRYMGSAALLLSAFPGGRGYGGVNSPYVWVHCPGQDSWQLFDRLLEESGIVCTPGVGFGAAGEGFLRFSAFAKRPVIEEALTALQEFNKIMSLT